MKQYTNRAKQGLNRFEVFKPNMTVDRLISRVGSEGASQSGNWPSESPGFCWTLPPSQSELTHSERARGQHSTEQKLCGVFLAFKYSKTVPEHKDILTFCIRGCGLTRLLLFQSSSISAGITSVMLSGT